MIRHRRADPADAAPAPGRETELGDTMDDFAFHAELVDPPLEREATAIRIPAVTERPPVGPGLPLALACGDRERPPLAVPLDGGLPSACDGAQRDPVRRAALGRHPVASLPGHAPSSRTSVATASTRAVCGKRSKARIESIRHVEPSRRTSRASVVGSQET